MKIPVWIDMQQEVEVDLGADDIRLILEEAEDEENKAVFNANMNRLRATIGQFEEENTIVNSQS